MASSPNRSAFRNRGGKQIIVHGVSDPIFSINDIMAWWDELDAANGGKASEFVRLFAVPGMGHSLGGPTLTHWDAFGALVEWVERGVAPDRILGRAGTHTPWQGRTRPLCPHPSQARYSGSGSIEDARNFTCTRIARDSSTR